MKKLSIGRLKKLLDTEFSLLVRSKGRCERCATTQNLQCAHIMSKGGHPALRWDILNCLCLCYRCHMHFAHKDPIAFTWWVQETFPERWEYIHATRYVNVQRNYEDLEQILTWIRAKDFHQLIVPLDIRT